MCTATWVSAPARSGTIFAPISSSQPACSASWNRCPSVRGSSAPAFLPSASSTACTAAAHSGVRFPRITPAPPNVVPACTYRSSNPSSSASGRDARHRSTATPAMIRRSSSDAPACAACTRILIVSARSSAGQLPRPLGDRQRLRLGDVRGGQRAGHGGVVAQQPHPPHLGLRIRPGHVRHRHQPRGRRAVPVSCHARRRRRTGPAPRRARR